MAYEEARRRALRERKAVYIYEMSSGGYWISEAAPETVAGWTGDLTFIEKFEPATRSGNGGLSP